MYYKQQLKNWCRRYVKAKWILSLTTMSLIICFCLFFLFVLWHVKNNKYKTKVEDLPENAKPHLSFQLSSPVEEGVLSKVYDPLNNDPAPEESVIIFKGVETSVATLTITASDADIPLGSSSPLEVATFCKRDPMEDDTNKKYVTELPVAIVAADAAGSTAQEPTADAKDGEADKVTTEEGASAAAAGDAEEGAKTEVVEITDVTEKQEVEEEATAVATEVTSIPPVCTAVLRFTYTPSPKDQKEDLYELLNKTTQRKAIALEKLRKISMAQGSSSAGSPTSGGGASSSTAVTKPAVKPGFLNKKKAAANAKGPTGLQKAYDTLLGPNSYTMLGLGFIMGAKDYIIFFGAMTFFHFRGQMLALPPPV